MKSIAMHWAVIGLSATAFIAVMKLLSNKYNIPFAQDVFNFV